MSRLARAARQHAHLPARGGATSRFEKKRLTACRLSRAAYLARRRARHGVSGASASPLRPAVGASGGRGPYPAYRAARGRQVEGGGGHGMLTYVAGMLRAWRRASCSMLCESSEDSVPEHGHGQNKATGRPHTTTDTRYAPAGLRYYSSSASSSGSGSTSRLPAARAAGASAAAAAR